MSIPCSREIRSCDRVNSGDSPPAYAISASEAPINRYLKFMANLVLPRSLAIEQISMTHDDHRAAVAAFQEKRTLNCTSH